MTSRKLWICNDCDSVFVIAPVRPNAKCRRCDNVAWVCPDDVISFSECSEMIKRGVNRHQARVERMGTAIYKLEQLREIFRRAHEAKRRGN